MKSVTIIISHYKSLSFLRTCIRQIRKYAHPEIVQKIIIADQSENDAVIAEYSNEQDIVVSWTKPLWSGYGIDHIMRNADIETDYVCQLHVDAFPISKNWLYLPIKLIEENDFSFVGQHQFIADGTQSIYPPTPFFAMSQCFNVARTETYKEMAMEGGFTRFHNRTTEFHNKIEMDKPMTWGNDDWSKWAKDDYYARGSDDDVIAFCWEDNHREHDKLGLAVTGFIEPSYGRVIEDIVFHFGSCREAANNMGAMPELYRTLTQKINNGYDDNLVNEILSLVQPQPDNMRDVWDGKLKQVSIPTEQLRNRIEQLKNV